MVVQPSRRHQLITGNSLSVTITLNEQVEMFPDGSVAIEFTVVVPIEKTLPEAGVEITVVEQLSVANTLNVTTALHFPGSALTYLFVQFNTGGILSVIAKPNNKGFSTLSVLVSLISKCVCGP